jgi:hypothetical protein
LNQYGPNEEHGTEETYLYWMRLFISFNDLKNSKEIGNHEVERFLNHLGGNKQVSSSTQNLALCADTYGSAFY